MKKIFFLILFPLLCLNVLKAQDLLLSVKEVQLDEASRTLRLKIWVSKESKALTSLTARNFEVTENIEEKSKGLQISQVLSSTSGDSISGNYTLVVYPNSESLPFKGEERIYAVKLLFNGLYATGTEHFRTGTADHPTLDPNLAATSGIGEMIINSWLPAFFIGILSIVGLLLIFNLVIPIIKNSNFKKQHVKIYSTVKEKNIVRRDPITGEVFEDAEPVVTVCNQMCSLSSWEYNGNQCPMYPECLHGAVLCAGQGGKTGNETFFSQKGVYKKLNWLWFGLLGGFISWIIWALFEVTPILSGFSNMLSAMLGHTFENNPDVQSNLGTLAGQTLMGAALGFGLMLGLTWVEERGQARLVSWGRILLRSFLGALSGLLIFFTGFFIQYLAIPNSYLVGLLYWLFFGVVLGFGLSIRSSVSSKRGMIGGIIASVVAWNIYFAITFLLAGNVQLSKLVSFLLMGGILGIIIVTIVTRLEDFELETISPQKYQRTSPISKWLKAGMDIAIGTDPANYVFIKWTDEAVLAKHLTLSYQNGQVFVEPHAEVLINNRPINGKTQLKDGDIIQPGSRSVTKMKFVAKK